MLILSCYAESQKCLQDLKKMMQDGANPCRIAKKPAGGCNTKMTTKCRI
jgi:hypothetical protein